MFIGNNCASSHLWWKANLLKIQKVSKYLNDWLQSFILLFMSLLAHPIFKNSHIKAGIQFIFLKNDRKQTWKSFNTKISTAVKRLEKELLIMANSRIYFISLKTVLTQTWKSFNTKISTSVKRSEKQLSFKKNLSTILQLKCSIFRSKLCERP